MLGSRARYILGNEGIDLAKVSDDIVDEALAILGVGDIALVGAGPDAVLLLELLHILLGAVLARSVGDGNRSTHLGAPAGSLDAHAPGPRSAGDGDDLALEGEEVEETVSLGDSLRHGGRVHVSGVREWDLACLGTGWPEQRVEQSRWGAKDGMKQGGRR